MKPDLQLQDQPGWVDRLNQIVLAQFNTRLVGGYPEPFYKAATREAYAEIRFTRDYTRSALHELAHWCVAGQERRLQDDYGYWYAPDGRSEAQQRLFFQVEVIPQAIEKHFCNALGIPFATSIDNLGNPSVSGIEDFTRAVDEACSDFALHGLPARALSICNTLYHWKDSVR
jgi:elongation factor P hydroxylase